MQVRPEEVEMLMSMDNAFLAEAREEQRAAMERMRDHGSDSPNG